MGVVGVVGIGLGIGLLGASSSKSSSADQQHDALLASGGTSACTVPNPSCDAYQSSYKSAASFRNAGVTSIVLGGLAGIGAVVFEFLPAGKAESSKGASVRVVPTLGGGRLEAEF